MALETIKYNPSENMQSMSVIAQSMQGNSQFINQFINTAINRTSFIDQMRKDDDNNFVQEQQDNIANERAERFDRRNRMEFAFDFGRQLDRDRENDRRFNQEYDAGRDDEFYDRGSDARDYNATEKDRSFDRGLALSREEREAEEFKLNKGYVAEDREHSKEDRVYKEKAEALDASRREQLTNAQKQVNILRAENLPFEEYNAKVKEIMSGVDPEVGSIISGSLINPETGRTNMLPNSSTSGTTGDTSKEIAKLDLAIAKEYDKLSVDSYGDKLEGDELDKTLKSNRAYQTLVKQRELLGGGEETTKGESRSESETQKIFKLANEYKSEAGLSGHEEKIPDMNTYYDVRGFDPVVIMQDLKNDIGIDLENDKTKYNAFIKSLRYEKELAKNKPLGDKDASEIDRLSGALSN